MKRRRSLTPVVLSLLIGLVGGLLVGGSAAVGAPVTLVIPISGTVDGSPESVYISGLAEVKSRPVRDPDFGTRTAVLVAIDLDVSGVGLSTGAPYRSDGGQRLVRLLMPSDVVQITFPFFPDGADGRLSARSALASFTLSFDVSSGALTAADVSVTTPNL